MDDLDHSVHLAEQDWESFHEESEECCLLLPTLAGLDDSSLSDAEDLEGAASSLVDTSDHDPKQIAYTSTVPSEPTAEGLRKADKVCAILQMQSRQRGLGEPDHPPDTPGDVSAPLEMSGILTISSESQKPCKSDVDHSEKNAAAKEVKTTGGAEQNRIEGAEQDTEVTYKSITDDQVSVEQSVMSELFNAGESALESPDHVGGACSGFSDLTDLEAISENKQKEGGSSSTLSAGIISQSRSPNRQHAELNKKTLEQSCSPDQVACGSDSSEAPRGEKERWFVTVNENFQRQRLPAAPLAKKKRRKKLVKICRSSDGNASTSDSTDDPFQCGPKCRVNESELEDMENFPPSCHHSTRQPTSPTCRDILNGGHFSDLKLMNTTPPSTEEEISSELPSDSIDDSTTLIVKQDLTDSLEQMDHGVLINNNDTTFTHINENAPKIGSTDSQESKDDTDFFSTASFDSDEYFSAADSAEESQQLHQTAQWHLSPMTQNILSDYICSASNTSPTEHITEAKLQSDMHENLLQEHESCKYTSNCTDFDSAKTHTVHGNDSIPQSSMIQTYASKHCSLSDAMMEKTVQEDKNLLDDCELLAPDNTVGDGERCPTSLPAVTVTTCSGLESPERSTTLVPARPVYAISAFWDEMEKLTIKDILQLRKTRSPSPMKEAHQLPTTAGEQVDVIDTHVRDNSIADSAEYLLTDSPQVDPSDTADSDYFTHLDDSKPDRSSCEFSTFSDFDEEYLQFIGASTNPSPEPQDLKLQDKMSNELMYYKGSLQEEDMDLGRQGNHVDVEQQTLQGFEDCVPNSLFSGSDTFLRGLTKSKSMRNVNAFEREVQLKDISLHSILEHAERSLIHSTSQLFEDSPFLEVNGNITPRTRSPSPIFRSVDIIDQQYQISFPEVFECLFEDDEPSNNCTALIYDQQSTKHMLLSPLQLSQGNKEEPVPIFSCTHSAPRDLTFPELDYLLFPLDTYAESEGEDDSSPIRVVTREDIQSKHAGSITAASYGHQNLFNKDGWQMDWKRLLSLRRIRFPGRGSSWCRRSGAWVFPPASHREPTSIDTDNQGTEVVTTRIPSMPPQVIELGQQIFRELAEQQRRLNALQTSFLMTRGDGLDFALKQSDMCLVCIAFASWVLRSTDPHAIDAWKAALLANVSALSAIRYLRRYMRRKSTEEEP